MASEVTTRWSGPVPRRRGSAGGDLRARPRPGAWGTIAGEVAAAILAAAFAATPALSQTVTGRLDEAGRWWVSLLDDRGSEVAGVVSASDGSFAVEAPHPGRFRVRAERVARAVHLSEAFELDPGSAGRAVALAPADAEPGPLDVDSEASSRCVADPGPGTVAGSVWRRARPALAVAEALAAGGGVLLDASVHRRDLGPDGRSVVRAEPVEVFEGVTRLVPAADAEDLVRRGFVREDAEGEYHFFAPTPAVLLSGAFRETHCFRVRGGAGTGALVGLAFEPARDDTVPRADTVPDVAGVLWLDATSGGPVLLEFAYRHFDLGISLGGSGGSMAFAELPDGSWVTPETVLRMPLLGVELDEATAEPRGWRLAGIREERIRLHRALAPDGAFSFTSPTGALAGTVRLHPDGPPLEGAEVRLTGTPFGAMTDELGRYRIEGLLEGTYAITAYHPRLEALPVGVETVEASVVEGRDREVALSAPPADEGAALLCGEAPREGGRVILSGQVVDSITAEPLAGVPVMLRFRDPRRTGAPHHESRVTSGTGGEFVYCDLPPLAEVRMRAEVPGRDGTSDDVFIAPSEGVVRRAVSVAFSTAREPAGVFGTVREHGSGRGIPSASVRLQGSPAAATTNANGFFALPDVQPGLQVLEVDALGYEPREVVVQMTGTGAARLEIDLTSQPIALEGITVSVVPRRLFGDMVDMQRRMELGFGTFVLNDELRRRGGSLSAALRGRGGIRIVSSSERRGGEYVVMRGMRDLTGETTGPDAVTYCYPAVYVDGSRITQPRSGGVGHEPVDLAVFPVDDIEAVEIYRGASAAPGEFGGGDAACGVLVVWTRRGGRSVRGTSGGGAGSGPLA